jgi:hypothetical protein
MVSRLLKPTLTANAASSAITGVALVAGAAPLSGWLGIPAWLSIVVGAGLLAFAVGVARVARNPLPSGVRQVIAADVAWVIGAAAVIVGFPGSMSTAGLWALGIVTVAVADFAILQTLGLRRMRASV